MTFEERNEINLMKKEAEEKNEKDAEELAKAGKIWRVVGKLEPRLIRVKVQ